MMPANRRIRPVPYQPSDGLERSMSPMPPTPARSRWWSIVRVGLGIASVVGLSIGVAWSARRYITTSPRFGVRSFQVAGNTRRTPDAIVAESGLTDGANIFTVDLDSARARILADPWVEDVVLVRHLPDTIVVQVTERVAAALVGIGDLYLAVADGAPFKKLEPGDPVDLPLISGITPENLAEDREGAQNMIRHGIEVAAEYEHCALARRAPLEEVHVAQDGELTLVVGHSATQLVLGGPPFRRKLDEAARVMAELDKRRAQASTIMLDNEARPDRVVARISPHP